MGALYSAKSWCELWFGQFDQAIKDASGALEPLKASADVESKGWSINVMQWSHLFKGDFDRVFILKEDLFRITGERNLRYVFALNAVTLANTYRGNWEVAVTEGQKAVKIAEDLSNDYMVSLTAGFISLTYNLKGDFARAQEYAEIAIHRATSSVDRAWAETYLALVWCKTGQAAKAIKILTTLVEQARSVHYVPNEVVNTLNLGEAYIWAGEYDKAKKLLSDGLQLASRCSYKYCIVKAHRLLGEITLEINASQAGTHFEKAIALSDEIGAQNELALSYAGYGRYHRHQGQVTKARDYLTKALEIFDSLDTLKEPDKLKKELTELPDG
jgi:tetratricopeptide (TPR) repeat protein